MKKETVVFCRLFAARGTLTPNSDPIATVGCRWRRSRRNPGLASLVKEKDAKIASLEERLAKVEQVLSNPANKEQK